MDNSPSDLEIQLSNLTPTAPSARLRKSLATALTTASAGVTDQRRRRSAYRSATTWTSWKWANWAVAAVLVMMLGLATRWTSPTIMTPPAAHAGLAQSNPAEVLRPVRAARTLIDSRPEAIIELPDGSPVERVRDYFVDTIEWRDANGDAQLRWELPRESVRFVALTSY